MFYVYQLKIMGIDLPFYIGKGKEERHKEHFVGYMIETNKGNKHKINTIKKAQREGLEVVSEIILDNLTEAEAHAAEIEYIARYGRRDLGTGCLTNLTDGGEGMSGFVPSEEQRQRQSELLSQPEYRDMFQKHTTELWKDETYRKNAMEGINRSWTDERRAATSVRSKNFAAKGCYDKCLENARIKLQNDPEARRLWIERQKNTRNKPEFKVQDSIRATERIQRKEVREKVWLPFYLSNRCYYKTEGWRLEYKKALQVCSLEMRMLYDKGYGAKRLCTFLFDVDEEYKLFSAICNAMRDPHGATGKPFNPIGDVEYMNWRSGQDVEAARKIVFRDKLDAVLDMLEMN
ncbi:hypothetical protein nACB2_031 [Acinetobacter phage nACB2]|nr:hypothetical protein nACB2_031 [Acinetobacter phage nACB2]